MVGSIGWSGTGSLPGFGTWPGISSGGVGCGGVGFGLCRMSMGLPPRWWVRWGSSLWRHRCEAGVSMPMASAAALLFLQQSLPAVPLFQRLLGKALQVHIVGAVRYLHPVGL